MYDVLVACVCDLVTIKNAGADFTPVQLFFCFFMHQLPSIRGLMGWWCSGILSGLLRRRSGVQIPDPPTLEKCAEGICLCNRD